MKIGIVSGETSGDILGAGLIRQLKAYYPDAVFSGIGGQKMLVEGFESLFPQDRLAVMGIIEPLKRLPELLSIRKQLYQYFSAQKFDVVIGIDSPDFNLSLEAKLKQKGIKTVHYVSPSVWAWRQWRIKKIARAVDLMLTLLPFETAIYHAHKIPVKFIGHPLADQFPLNHDQSQAQKTLAALLHSAQYNSDKPLLACLPGSRHGEVKLIGPAFLDAIELCRKKISDLQIIIPAANVQRRQQIEMQLQQHPQLPVTVIDGHSHELMAAADAVLLASGTTALEAMLLKKPMVVVYKMASVSYWIISSLLKAPYISLPNLLADQPLVPEILQEHATPEAIADSVLAQLQQSDKHKQQLVDNFKELHRQIKCDADQQAAKAIYALIELR